MDLLDAGSSSKWDIPTLAENAVLTVDWDLLEGDEKESVDDFLSDATEGPRASRMAESLRERAIRAEGESEKFLPVYGAQVLTSLGKSQLVLDSLAQPLSDNKSDPVRLFNKIYKANSDYLLVPAIAAGMVAATYKVAPFSDQTTYAKMHLSCGRVGPTHVLTNLHGLRISSNEDLLLRPRNKPGQGTKKSLQVIQVVEDVQVQLNRNATKGAFEEPTFGRCVLRVPDKVRATDTCAAVKALNELGDRGLLAKVEAAEVSYVPNWLPHTQDPVTRAILSSQEGLDPDAVLLQELSDPKPKVRSVPNGKLVEVVNAQLQSQAQIFVVPGLVCDPVIVDKNHLTSDSAVRLPVYCVGCPGTKWKTSEEEIMKLSPEFIRAKVREGFLITAAAEKLKKTIEDHLGAHDLCFAVGEVVVFKDGFVLSVLLLGHSCLTVGGKSGCLVYPMRGPPGVSISLHFGPTELDSTFDPKDIPAGEYAWGKDKELNITVGPEWNGSIPFSSPRMLFVLLPLLEDYPRPTDPYWRMNLGQHQLPAFQHLLEFGLHYLAQFLKDTEPGEGAKVWLQYVVDHHELDSHRLTPMGRTPTKEIAEYLAGMPNVRKEVERLLKEEFATGGLYKEALMKRAGAIQGCWDDFYCETDPETGDYVRDAFPVGGNLLSFLRLRKWRDVRWLAEQLSKPDTIENYIPKNKLATEYLRDEGGKGKEEEAGGSTETKAAGAAEGMEEKETMARAAKIDTTNTNRETDPQVSDGTAISSMISDASSDSRSILQEAVDAASGAKEAFFQGIHMTPEEKAAAKAKDLLAQRMQEASLIDKPVTQLAGEIAVATKES